VAAQRRADRGCRDLHAQPKQLALDTLVAPARILPGQTHDQRLHVLIQRRSPWSARIRPRAGDQATMPAQQRLRLDKEAGPARSGQHAADRSQQGTVGGLEPGPWDLAAQDAELVAQDQEFQVLGGIAAGQERKQLDRAAQREVGDP
jgi:hypothetical protein